MDRRKAWRLRNKKKEKANWTVWYALKKGLLKKDDCCLICDRVGKHKRKNGLQLNGHHPDYDKPLHVYWLCQTCHRMIHKLLLFFEKLTGMTVKEFKYAVAVKDNVRGGSGVRADGQGAGLGSDGLSGSAFRSGGDNTDQETA